MHFGKAIPTQACTASPGLQWRLTGPMKTANLDDKIPLCKKAQILLCMGFGIKLQMFYSRVTENKLKAVARQSVCFKYEF